MKNNFIILKKTKKILVEIFIKILCNLYLYHLLYMCLGIGWMEIKWYQSIGGARGVIVIVVGNGHGDTSSNPRRDWLHFT